MKIIAATLVLCTFIFSSQSFCQTDDLDDKKEQNKEEYKDDQKVFRIGINLTPQVYLFNNASMENVNSTYKYAYNMDVVLIFSAKFGSVFEAKTGIGYSSKNFDREEQCIICGNDIVEGNKFRINYIEIPLLANLYFYNSRLDVYGIIGIKNSFLLSAKNKHKANIEQDIETTFNVKEDFAKYLLGIQGGIGLNYNLTYSLSLSTEILYNFNPIKFERSTGLNFHSLGLNIGLNLKI
jgi:hypothetical protein